MKPLRIASLTLAACAVLLPTSCRSPEPVPDGVEVVIKRDHSHSKYCGHYQHEGIWYYSGADHKHGTGCGHHYRDGGWYLTRDD